MNAKEELSTKYCALIGVKIPPAPPLCTEDIVIGRGGLEPGTMAKFTEPLGCVGGEE